MFFVKKEEKLELNRNYVISCFLGSGFLFISNEVKLSTCIRQS